MKPLMIMSALFLTACSRPEPEIIYRTEYITPVIPEELRRPVKVNCKDGSVSKSLGECAIAYKAGLSKANSKLIAIGQIVDDHAGSVSQ